jgi:protein-L-isoaspartate(D-aspartate) O-methyltransferase
MSGHIFGSHAMTEREQMVREQLADRGVRDERVLGVMARVPREQFVAPGQLGRAYCDGALPIDCQQTISQPFIVARMTELLELRPADTVLEVGTGSGYQTAILALLAARVFTIEWHLKLLNRAAERLRSLGIGNVSYRCADGSLGWPDVAPFNAIIVTAGAPDVPPLLREQLAPEGRLVVPAGAIDDQLLVRIRRTPQGFEREDLLRCRFVKLQGAAGWRQ